MQVLYPREIDPCPPSGGIYSPHIKDGSLPQGGWVLGWQCLQGSIHPVGGIFLLLHGARSLISPTVSGWTWPCAHSYVSETCAHRLPLPWKYNICSNHTAVRQFVYLLVPYIYCKWEERHKEMNEPEQPLAMNMKLFLLSAIWRHLLRWLFPSWLDQNWLICGRPPPHWSLLLESSWPNLSSLWSSVRPTPTPYYIIYEQLINDPLRMKSYLNQIILNVPIDRGLVQEPHWRK